MACATFHLSAAQPRVECLRAQPGPCLIRLVRVEELGIFGIKGIGESGQPLFPSFVADDGHLVYLVVEVMAVSKVPVMVEYVDVLQIGARNMQNFNLLRAVGDTRTPVLLKRGMSATVEDLLMAAEYILAGGNERVVLCERGIRTFETATRNTTDINAIPVLQSLTHLPVVLDPSHSTGHYDYVTAVAKAAVAVGADGIIVEVHPDPAHALSDGRQSLTPENFSIMVRKLKAVAEAVDRRLVSTKSPLLAGEG